jgi:multiple sugar transport system ATP-binding protein
LGTGCAGVVQQVATPGELYERPRNLFVAGFIGSPSMNFLPATFEGGDLHTPLGNITLQATFGPRSRGPAPATT